MVDWAVYCRCAKITSLVQLAVLCVFYLRSFSVGARAMPDILGSIENAEETTIGVFSPRSKLELKTAVRTCLAQDDCLYGSIGEWDVSRVTSVSGVFFGASSFNRDISRWDVSQITDMRGMFSGATTFDADISKWDVSRVKNMGGMFIDAISFNSDISQWDVSRVNFMGRMFFGATSFNSDISEWDVSKSAYMGGMFEDATSFNADISTWDVSRAFYIGGMFEGATSFNSDISKWDVSRVRYLGRMYEGAVSFSSDISEWDVSRVTYMGGMLEGAISFQGDISRWDVSRVTYMGGMFEGATAFNSDISRWDVSRVSDMGGMFQDATSFASDISRWDVSRVTNMLFMFTNTGNFSSNILNWDVASVTEMWGMFSGATSFDADISRWDVSRVSDMGGMFQEATSFNADISQWDVSRVTNMWGMFTGLASFNSNISKWEVLHVTDMHDMFSLAKSFNGDISEWDVSKVNNVAYMFQSAKAFDADISQWDVSKVTDMQGMFYGALSFNADISFWDVSRVLNMRGMFFEARAFSQSLCGGDWVYSKADVRQMFTASLGSISRVQCIKITTAPSTCAKCGTLLKSGQRSCCAVGGAWFNKCGESEETGFDHTWIDGIQACKESSLPTTCSTCGIEKNTGRLSCCAPGGTWFRQCGYHGDPSFRHTFVEGLEACAGMDSSKTSMHPTVTKTNNKCTKCGINIESGESSCCISGGAWFGNCGYPGDSDAEHTWFEGIKACRGTDGTDDPKISPITTITSDSVCPKCGAIPISGKRSCCVQGGAWFGECGDDGDPNFGHTWDEGLQACKDTDIKYDLPNLIVTTSTSTTITTTITTTVTTTLGPMCPKCGANKNSGKLSCCVKGGAWFNKCGDPWENQFDHTWFEGILACKPAPSTLRSTAACPICGIEKNSGKWSCCAPGASWFKGCGYMGDRYFKHTWSDGLRACKEDEETTTEPQTTISTLCPKCSNNIHTGMRSCCARGAAWFGECGDEGDPNFEHTWDEGMKACQVTTNDLSESLHVTAANGLCPKCGTSKKSGKWSCCGHGAAWFGKCGNPGDLNFEHTWDDGVKACEVTGTNVDSSEKPSVAETSIACPKCGTNTKTGRRSCCVRGGAWFEKCGDAGNPNFEHTWLEGMKACDIFQNGGLRSRVIPEVELYVREENTVSKVGTDCVNSVEVHNIVLYTGPMLATMQLLF